MTSTDGTPGGTAGSAPLRPTRQRRAVMEALESFDDFRSAQEIHDLLGRRGDPVGLATVYRTLQRLAKGLYAVQEELDLHGAGAQQAEALLRRFIVESVDAGAGCVRIAHGKGIHSDSGIPLLKNLVDRLLRQRTDVLAFHSAPAAQGGTGAVLVLLAPRAGRR